MDAGQIFTGAGATTTVGLLAFVLYRLLTSSHCRSRCCDRSISFDFSSSTPTRRASAPTIEMPRTEAIIMTTPAGQKKSDGGEAGP